MALFFVVVIVVIGSLKNQIWLGIHLKLLLLFRYFVLVIDSLEFQIWLGIR